jgi:hypothetical protein
MRNILKQFCYKLKMLHVNCAATRLRTFNIFYLKIDDSFTHDKISRLAENK